MSDLFRSAAPAYWDRGLSVVPLEPGSKRPAKELSGWQGYCNGPVSASTRSEWLARYVPNGIGLLLSTQIGDGRRIGAVDVDDDALVAVTRLIVGDCISGKRGRKGETIFVTVRDDRPVKSTVLHDYAKAPKIDILFGGKMAVLPPSIHPDIRLPYHWVGTPLLDCEFDRLPVLTPRKLELLRLVARSEQSWTLISGDGTHEAGMVLVWRLVEFGCDDGEISGIITSLLPKTYRGNSLDELPGWIDSARRKIGSVERQLPLDEEIARAVEGSLSPLAFVPAEGFRRYLDGYWPLVSELELDQRIKSLVVPRMKPKQQVSTFINGVRRCLSLNTARPGFGTHGHSIIGLANGTYDARLGAFLEHAPEHELRFRLDFDFDPAARCPTYEQQLDDTFAGNRLALQLFDEFAGLTLIPDMRFQKAMYLIGEAGCGKSTLLRVLESMHDPDAVAVTPLDRLDGERYLTNLVHKLICISFDVQTTKAVFGEAFVRITGGDPIAVRKLYQEVEGRVVPSVRFVGSMNLDIPRSIGAGDALRRRLIFLQCGRRIDSPDPDRDRKLREERPGIFLRWMSALDQLLKRRHFEIPQESVDEVTDYTGAQDPVATFFAERIEIDPNAELRFPDLVRAHNEWADELQERRLSGPVLGRKLRALGVESGWTSEGSGTNRRKHRVLRARLKRLLPDY